MRFIRQEGAMPSLRESGLFAYLLESWVRNHGRTASDHAQQNCEKHFHLPILRDRKENATRGWFAMRMPNSKHAKLGGKDAPFSAPGFKLRVNPTIQIAALRAPGMAFQRMNQASK